MSRDLESFVDRRGTRPERIRAVLGGYCNGPREDALFEVPGAQAVLEELAENCRGRLDGLAAEDLYEIAGELAPLGVLLELTVLASPRRPTVSPLVVGLEVVAREADREPPGDARLDPAPVPLLRRGDGYTSSGTS